MRILSLTLIISMLFVPTTFSLPTAPAPLAAVIPVSPAAEDKVGIVAAVRGAVKINPQGQVGRVAGSGEPIYLNDEISTDGAGSLQILLMDETAFTIGPNSTIVIDKFVYDPSTHNGEVKAKVVKGVFRFVTGKIGQKKPSQMEVELPIGTIGIRGTIVAGETNGNNSLVALLGPGENNNTFHSNGKFILSNTVNGKTEESEVSKSGFGTTINESGVPSNPFQIPEADLQRLANALGPINPGNSQSSGGSQGDSEEEEGGESPTEQSGQGTATASENSKIFTAFANLVQNFIFETKQSSQDTASENTDIQEGITLASDLSKISTGQHHYSASNIPFQLGTGTYSFTLNIDFGARTVGGGSSSISGSTTRLDGGDAFQFDLSTKSFPSAGFAAFSYSLPQGSDKAGGIKTDASGIFVVNFTNSGGDIATGSQHTFVVTDVPAATSDFGSASAPRSSGLSA